MRNDYSSTLDPETRIAFNRHVDAVWDAFAIALDLNYKAEEIMQDLKPKYCNASNTVLLYLNLAAEFQNDREKCSEYLRIAQENAIQYVEYLNYDNNMRDTIVSSRIPQESIDQLKHIITNDYDIRGLNRLVRRNLGCNRDSMCKTLRNFVKRTMSGEDIPNDEIQNYPRDQRRVVAYFRVSYKAVKGMNPSKVEGYYKIPVEEYFAELKAFKDDPIKQSVVVMDFCIQTAISECMQNFNDACRVLTE